MLTGIQKARQLLAGAKGDAVRRALSTPDGKVLLEALEETFIYGDLFGADDRETNRNLGGREVVMHLRLLAKVSEVAEHERKTGR
jgi:hypothetical protein